MFAIKDSDRILEDVSRYLARCDLKHIRKFYNLLINVNFLTIESLNIEVGSNKSHSYHMTRVLYL